MILPRGASVVVGVEVPLVNVEDENGNIISQSLLQPTAIINYQGQRYDLKLKCIFLDKLYLFENYDLDSCFRTMPVIQDQNQAFNNAAGLFLSRRVADSFIGRMYLLNMDSEYFKLAYDDTSSGIPLAIYQGRIIGPFRIWKVEYPDNFEITDDDAEYFLRFSYNDTSLLNPL